MSWRLLATGLFLVGPLFGPIMTIPSLEQLAAADAIVVGRVVAVQVGDALPPEQQKWQVPVYQHLAEVEVLRFRAEDDALRERLDAAGVVRIGYRAERRRVRVSVAGGTVWPTIAAGEIRIFALRAREDGAFELWLDEGIGAVPPAHSPLRKEAPVANATEFLEREVANALASGDPAVAFAMAGYARHGLRMALYAAEPRAQQAQLLAEMLDGDVSRAQKAAAALLASQATRASIQALAAGSAGEGMLVTAVERLMTVSLQQLPAEDRERLLIEELLRNLPVYSWGAAEAFVQLKDHPALDAPLEEAITARRPHVLFVLERLIRSGRSDLVSRTMALVRERLADPQDPGGDRPSAGRLLWAHGAAEDFEYFLSLVRAAQQDDPEHYLALWSAAAHYENAPRPQAYRFAAIYLGDRRTSKGGLRYCDLAVGWIIALSGDRFGLDMRIPLGEAPLAMRDAAVARAAEWLARQLAKTE